MTDVPRAEPPPSDGAGLADRIGAWGPIVALAALGALYAWAQFASTFHHPGSIGANYVAPGTDWMVMYEAARLARAGRFALMTNGDDFTAHLNAVFASRLPSPLPYRPWVYPPIFLIPLGSLKGLGFPVSYLVSQLFGAAVLAAALLYRAPRPVAARRLALAAIVCPAAAINAILGQTGLLVAGLLVAGCRLRAARPLAAGAMLGMLACKPQFGLLLPALMVAEGRWRALSAMAAAAAALVAASLLLYGMQPWIDWAHRMVEGVASIRNKWMQNDRLWGNSIYSYAVLLGLPQRAASIAQGAATLCGAACVWLAARRRPDPDLMLAILLAASFLAAPHSGAYDGALPVIAVGLWLACGHARQNGASLLALAIWMIPLFSPAAVMPAGRLAPLLLIGLPLVLLRDCRAGAEPR